MISVLVQLEDLLTAFLTERAGGGWAGRGVEVPSCAVHMGAVLGSFWSCCHPQGWPVPGPTPPFHGGSGVRMSLSVFRVLSDLSHKALGLPCSPFESHRCIVPHCRAQHKCSESLVWGRLKMDKYLCGQWLEKSRSLLHIFCFLAETRAV